MLYYLQQSLFSFLKDMEGMFLLFSLSRVQLCNPMDYSTSGFPILHYLPEFAETHVHGVGDAIQPSPPLSFPYIWKLFLLFSSVLFWMPCLVNFFLDLPQGGILRILRTGGKKWTVGRNPWFPPRLKVWKPLDSQRVHPKPPALALLRTYLKCILLDCSPLYCIKSPGMEPSNLWMY